MVLMQMKHRCMGIGFIQQIMLFLIIRQPYSMDHYTVKRFYKKRHLKDKQICEIYLVLTFQVQVRAIIIGNSAPAVGVQQALKSMFKALINADYFIGIDNERYQGVLEHALSKVDFSVGIGIYIPPSNLNLNIERTKGHNNKILVSNTNVKIGSNRDIHRDHEKLAEGKPDVAKK